MQTCRPGFSSCALAQAAFAAEPIIIHVTHHRRLVVFPFTSPPRCRLPPLVLVIMRSTRCSKPDMPVSPPNTRSRARARNDGTVPEVVGKRRRGHGAHDGDLDAGDDDLVNDEPAYDDSWHDGRDRSPSRSRSRSLSVIPTSEMPPLTLPAPDDAAVRALGLSQSARPGATALSLEYEHLVRMREGHFTRSRPDPATAPTEGKRNWNELSISEAAWIRLEEVGVINKGRSWTSRVGLDDSGDREYTFAP